MLNWIQNNIKAVVCEASDEPFNMAEKLGINFTGDIAQIPSIIVVNHISFSPTTLKFSYEIDDNAIITLICSGGIYAFSYEGNWYHTNGILSPLTDNNFWDTSISSINTINYINGNIMVRNGREWVKYEFPTGTTVEEITAEEVTNKFT